MQWKVHVDAEEPPANLGLGVVPVDLQELMFNMGAGKVHVDLKEPPPNLDEGEGSCRST